MGTRGIRKYRPTIGFQKMLRKKATTAALYSIRPSQDSSPK
jgi:hypothetical protein